MLGNVLGMLWECLGMLGVAVGMPGDALEMLAEDKACKNDVLNSFVREQAPRLNSQWLFRRLFRTLHSRLFRTSFPSERDVFQHFHILHGLKHALFSGTHVQEQFFYPSLESVVVATLPHPRL